MHPNIVELGHAVVCKDSMLRLITTLNIARKWKIDSKYGRALILVANILDKIDNAKNMRRSFKRVFQLVS